MAEVTGQRIYLGGIEVTPRLGNNIVVVNPTQIAPIVYGFRTDIYSGSAVFATPGYLFEDLSMTYDWSDVHADLAGTGTNKTVLTTNISATAGTNFPSDGYVSSSLAAANSAIYQTDDTDFEFGTGNFTMETWYRAVDNNPLAMFFWKYTAGSAANSEFFLDIANDRLRAAVDYNGNNEIFFQSNVLTWTTDQWYHIAIVRNGTACAIYRDGVSVATGTLPSGANINTTSVPMSIFARPLNTTYEAIQFQDTRIYKGIAKYTAAFTPPASMVTAEPQDSNAAAFLSATQIIDPTISEAVNELVIDLKAAGIWNKMVAIYPFVGGTSSTTSYNLKDTSTFQITWNSGFTFSADGVTASGTNSSTTGINISTDLSQDDASVALYVGSNTAGEDLIDMGAVSGGNGIQMVTRNVADEWGGKMMDNTNNNYSNADARGFYQFSRDNSSSYYAQKNTTRNTSTQTSSAPPSVVLAIGGLPSAAYATKQYRFASAGTALTTSQMDAYYTAVQKFQTTLGRNV